MKERHHRFCVHGAIAKYPREELLDVCTLWYRKEAQGTRKPVLSPASHRAERVMKGSSVKGEVELSVPQSMVSNDPSFHLRFI
jgi:hypothetical protein